MCWVSATLIVLAAIMWQHGQFVCALLITQICQNITSLNIIKLCNFLCQFDFWQKIRCHLWFFCGHFEQWQRNLHRLFWHWLCFHTGYIWKHTLEKSQTLWTISSFLTKLFAQTLWPILLEFHCIHPHHALKSMNSFTPVIIYVNVSNEYELVLDLFILVWTTGWAKKHAVVSSSSYHGWMCMKVIRRLLSRGLLLSVYATQLYYSTTMFCINTI